MSKQAWADNMWPEEERDSLQEIDNISNANFVTKIMLLSKEEEIIRKELFSRLGIGSSVYLSKDNMSKIFLRAMSKAFKKLYGDMEVMR